MTFEYHENHDATAQKKRGKGWVLILVILALLLLTWVLVYPDVFAIQPIGTLHDKITSVYYSIRSEMSFSSFPDGLFEGIKGGLSKFGEGVTNLYQGIMP